MQERYWIPAHKVSSRDYFIQMAVQTCYDRHGSVRSVSQSGFCGGMTVSEMRSWVLHRHGCLRRLGTFTCHHSIHAWNLVATPLFWERDNKCFCAKWSYFRLLRQAISDRLRNLSKVNCDWTIISHLDVQSTVESVSEVYTAQLCRRTRKCISRSRRNGIASALRMTYNLGHANNQHVSVQWDARQPSSPQFWGVYSYSIKINGWNRFCVIVN